MPHDSLNAAVARTGRQVRRRPDDPAAARAFEDARRALRERQMAQAITKIAAKAPPLTDEQITRLVHLLRGAA